MIDVLRLFGPFAVWFACFSAVYGLHGVVCSDRWNMAGLTLADGRVVLMAAWLAAIVLQLAIVLVLRLPRFASTSGLATSVSLWLAGAAVVATLWALFPVAVTSTCL